MTKYLKNKFESSLFIFSAIFFFKLPNIYLIPFLKEPILTLHVLARAMLITSFFLNFKKIEEIINENKKLLIIMILFVAQSLSILQSINLTSFFVRYKEIIIGFVAFYIGLLFQKKNLQIIKILLITSTFNIFIQACFLLFPEFFLNFFNYFLYDKLYDLVIINFRRSRTYFETFDEIILPIFFLSFVKIRKKNNNWIFLLFFTLSVIVIFSGWRIRLLMLIFGLVSSSFFIKIERRYLIVFFLSFILLIFSSKYINYKNVFMRINLKEENISSLNSRLDHLHFAYEIIKTRPLGLGLGNYYDYSSTTVKNRKYLLTEEIRRKENILAEEYSHNIFGLLLVESGVPSFIIFLIILLIFLKNDFRLILLRDYSKITFMIGFWTIFLYSLFNPLISGSVNFLFWFLRGCSIIIHEEY